MRFTSTPRLHHPTPSEPRHRPGVSSPRRARSRHHLGLALALALCAVPAISGARAQGPALAQSGVSLSDIARQPDSGLLYQRLESPRNAIFDQQKAAPVYTLEDGALTPLKAWGAPGVALFDADGDGDLDIYVPNGPGAANSLFSNQLVETGSLSFVDRGLASGTAAVDHDSGGVCFGDTDNDGDEDLIVVSVSGATRMFENRGDGTFLDISATAGLGGETSTSTACSLGDIDNDGLLDLAVGNAYTNFDHQIPIFLDPFSLNEHNQLFLNLGSNRFTDISEEAGIRELRGFVPDSPGAATITWAIALVDVDRDGDLDLVHADDQGAIPSAKYQGLSRGFIHVLKNDGQGHFTDVTPDVGTDSPGQWMGLAFGDLNCDGRLDIFGSNAGDYLLTILPLPYERGDSTSRAFFGNGEGGFDDPGVGDLLASPFGWGTEIVDYDNDGAPDVVFHGGLDTGPLVEASNAGVLLLNRGCTGDLALDRGARSPTDHSRRNVQGLAVGDLDGNGFADVVTVSNFDASPLVPLVPFPTRYGSPFDDEVFFIPTFLPTENPREFIFSGIELEGGSLSVEMNSGNGNGWIRVHPMGSVGLTERGSVNRSGIGAEVSFTPQGLPTVSKPVVGGASTASQSSLTLGFGLGDTASAGTLEVLWPGGVRNRLYDVHNGERLTLPEIPCGFDAPWESTGAYIACVAVSLADLRRAGILDPHLSNRLMSSALRARREP